MNDRSLKILIIDDDLFQVDSLRELLEAAGNVWFELESVATLEEAHERMMLDSFQLILLDLSLSEGQGFEVLLRMHKEEASSPIIVLVEPDHSK